MADALDNITFNSGQLKKELESLFLRKATLAGFRDSLEARKKSLLKSVGEAKARDALKEEVSKVFNVLQSKAHHRSVGSYEELLTYLLKDVLPEEGSVHLKPEYKSNETWLDLFVKKPGSESPESLEANGGALTNVVSTGLRFISLSKTNNRKLLILDEPDCWVEERRVESFFKVISEVSVSAGFQTFFISHHPAQMFEDNSSIIELKRQYADDTSVQEEDDEFIFDFDESPVVNEGVVNKKYKVVAENRSLIKKEWDSDSTVGIRGLELINVRQHSHTYIPCFPGANALIGGNNVGKSTALIAALRAICYGECDDSIIQHDKDEALIILHLEDHKKLQLSRKKGRSPPLIFSLFQNDTLIQEGKVSKRNSVPDWVSDLIGVAKVDDLDIQLVSQKSPVFLLQESGPKRAKILSVGSEAENLNKIMKLYEGIKSEDRETIKQGELELSKIHDTLKQMEALAKADELLAELAIDFDDMWENFEFLEKAFSFESILERAQSAHLKSKAVNDVPDLLSIDVPALKPVSNLETWISQISKKTLTVPAVDFPEEPKLKTTDLILEHGRKLRFAHDKFETTKNIPVIDWTAFDITVDFLKQSQISSAVNQIDAFQKTWSQSANAEKTAQDQVTGKEGQLHGIIEQLGGVCPTCDQKWPKGYFGE